MYCPRCGIHNIDTHLLCSVCEADLLPTQEKDAPVTVLADISGIRFRAIARELIRQNALLAPLAIPIAWVIYCGKKLRGAPFWSPMLTSRTPKFHLTNVARLPKLHRASFEAAEQFLRREGFEPFCDLEDVSLVQGAVQHIMRHPTRRMYAAVVISNATGKILYTSFSAFFDDERVLSVDNTSAISLRLPEKIQASHLPYQSLERTYQEFARQVEAMSVAPECADLKEVQPRYYRLRVQNIELGLQQGVLALKEPSPSPAGASSSVIPCYQHPGQVAVRTCAECGVGLCDACYIESLHQSYCQRCFARKTDAAPLSSELAESEGYAGFAARCVASCCDMLLISAMWIALFFLFSYLIKMAWPDEESSRLPLLLTEVLGSAGLIWYLIAPIARYGRTFGQKLWGLRVVDGKGSTPELVAALIRFAYFLVSCLFLFPLIGYLVVLFTKKKRGWHDLLAGTYVVTKRPRLKAALAWGLLVALLVGMAGGAYHFRQTVFSPLFAALYGGTPEIALPPKWEYPREKQDMAITSFIKRGEMCIASTASEVLAVEMKTGAIRWTNRQISGATIEPQSANTELPVIVVRYERDGKTVIARIDPDSGQTLWQQTLPLAFAQVTLDEQAIAAYADRVVSAFDLNGRPLWTKRFDGKADISYAQWHSGLLIGQFREKQNDAIEVALLYLDRSSGSVIWEQQDRQEFPRYVVEKDWQIFSKPEGGVALIHLPDRKRLWETTDDTDDIVAQDGDLLYGMTAAFDRQTGALRFDYPDRSTFSGLTHDFVLALQEINPQKKSLLLIDKITGEIKQNIEDRGWYFAKYLTEDERALYLAMYVKPEGADSTVIRSELAQIDKQTFSVTKIPIGNNLGMLQFEIFTQERLVFIPSFQRLGGYMLER